MRWFQFAPAVVFFAAALALGADPVVSENPVPPDSFAEVKYALEKGDSVTWEVSPEPKKVAEHTDGGTAVLHFNGPAGAYTVTAFVVNFDTKKFTKKRTAVTIGRPTPVPPVPVPPGPGPQPDPSPAGTVKRFVVVEDTSAAGDWRGKILGSPRVATYYKTAGLTHRLLSVKAEFAATDPDAKYVQAVAGKKLPYIWTFDALGREIANAECPLEEVAFLKLIGGAAGDEDRRFGNNEPPEGKLRLKWSTFGESPKVPYIPRDKWQPVDLSTFLPPVHDQNGRGQCNASATCTALEACRAQAGLPYVYLSAGDLYSQINGGRDQGSLLEDGLDAAVNSGVATVKTVPYIWDGRRHQDAATLAERKRFRAVECYVCPDFDAMASALQQGFFIVEGLMWFNNFTPDRDGWLPSVGRGGGGGHALCGYGLARHPNGTWGIMTRNSWSERWGAAGNCVIPEPLFGRQIGGFWAVRSVVQSQTAVEPKRDPFAMFDKSLALAW